MQFRFQLSEQSESVVPFLLQKRSEVCALGCVLALVQVNHTLFTSSLTIAFIKFCVNLWMPPLFLGLYSNPGVGMFFAPPSGTPYNPVYDPAQFQFASPGIINISPEQQYFNF
jgi:hypothetical protein